jgi:hypothetical protein
VLVKGECPPPVTDAADPALPPEFARFFALHPDYTEPSRVQQQCWPAALTGADRDALGLPPTYH